MIKLEALENIEWKKTARDLMQKISMFNRKQKLSAAAAVFLFILLFWGIIAAGQKQEKAEEQKLAGSSDINNILSNQKADIGEREKSEAPQAQTYSKNSFKDVFDRNVARGFGFSFTGTISRMLSSKESKILQVPGDFESIQKAIDSAGSGDVIKVAAGEYKENLVMKNGVSLIGENAETTVLNGNQAGNAVSFKGISDKNTRFENFTVKNAKKDLSGILIEDSSPLINRNIILQNDYDIYIKGESSPVIQRNRLSESKAGVQIFNLKKPANSVPVISDNLIFGNKKGINIYEGNAIIEHNTVSFNSDYGIDAGATFGIYMSSSSAAIRNNIITDNGVCEICSGIYVDDKSKDISIGFNNVWNNQSNFVCFGGCVMEESNFSDDPLFGNGLLYDFSLKLESPFLTAGSDGQKLGARL